MALKFTFTTVFVAWTLVFAAATRATAAAAAQEDSVDRDECFGTKCETGCCPWEDWFCCDGNATGYCAYYKEDCDAITTTTTTTFPSPSTSEEPQHSSDEPTSVGLSDSTAQSNQTPASTTAAPDTSTSEEPQDSSIEPTSVGSSSLQTNQSPATGRFLS